MKLLLTLPALAAFATSAYAQVTGFNVNLDGSANTYTENFKRWVVTSPAVDDPQGFTWGANVGTGATGGLVVDNHTNANNLYYRPSGGSGQPGDNATSTFDIAGLAAGFTFNTSLDFKWSNSTATDLTLITLGFAPNRTQNSLSSAGMLGGTIIRTPGTNSGNTVRLRMRTGTTDLAVLDFNQSTLVAGEWYRLSLDLTKTETLNIFDYTLSLYSIGANGTSNATLVSYTVGENTTSASITGTGTNSVIYSDSDAFFGYDIRDTSGNKIGRAHV